MVELDTESGNWAQVTISLPKSSLSSTIPRGSCPADLLPSRVTHSVISVDAHPTRQSFKLVLSRATGVFDQSHLLGCRLPFAANPQTTDFVPADVSHATFSHESAATLLSGIIHGRGPGEERAEEPGGATTWATLPSFAAIGLMYEGPYDRARFPGSFAIPFLLYSVILTLTVNRLLV